MGAGFGPSPRQVCTLVPVPLLPRPHTPLATEYPTLVGSMGTGYGQTEPPRANRFYRGGLRHFPSLLLARRHIQPWLRWAQTRADSLLRRCIRSARRAPHTPPTRRKHRCVMRKGVLFFLASHQPRSPSPFHAPPFAASDPWVILVCEDVPFICFVCDSVRS